MSVRMNEPTSDESDIAGRYSSVRSTKGYGALHEAAIRCAYEAVLQPGDTAIDGGAHSGKHTIPMAQAVGETGRVLAFEPSPDPFRLLQTAVADHGLSQVTAIQKAVSDKASSATSFLVFSDRPGVSGFTRRTDAAGDLPADEISVEVTTIDTYSDHLGATAFIKLDVEGAELLALAGARNVIAKHLPVVHIEASYISWDAFGYGPSELVAFCAEFGYRIVDVIGTPLDSAAAIDESFRTPSVWDYVLLPPTADGDSALNSLREHAANHYGL